jgi:hypothetical protein
MEVIMNKKRFLFILPVCLVFCLWLTTCGEKYEQVDDLWENLRNTAWLNDDTPVKPTKIGFYGPKNGPYKDILPINNSPYVVIIENDNKWWRDLKFDRTGNEIISPDIIDENGKNHTCANRISLSDNGEKLTIKNVKKPDWGVVPLGTYTKISSDPNYSWDN